MCAFEGETNGGRYQVLNPKKKKKKSKNQASFNSGMGLLSIAEPHQGL
jgi:hypothetical protein